MIESQKESEGKNVIIEEENKFDNMLQTKENEIILESLKVGKSIY